MTSAATTTTTIPAPAALAADAEHYSVPLVRLDITQKIKTWDAPSGIPGPIKRLMSVTASVDDNDDDDEAAPDNVPIGGDDESSESIRAL